MPETHELSSVLTPLIFGTATFAHQYNEDPFSLPTITLVHQALSHGICAFDTSPYYGPAEELLGQALDNTDVKNSFPRSSYALLTKVGRIAASEFDYSPEWVRYSVQRSLKRLKTDYLDVVYCHDVEFVSTKEVIAAVKELRKIRDESGAVRYVGISGYPVPVLCNLAETILRETGEPLDIVQSYANHTLQNTQLGSDALQHMVAAGVKVVTNASPLGMGLLRGKGVPIGALGDFHPSETGLRQACHKAGAYCEAHNEKLENVALRYAMLTWLHDGSSVGAGKVGQLKREINGELTRTKLGITVIGCSSVEELDQTIEIWRHVLEGLDGGSETGTHQSRDKGGDAKNDVFAELVSGVQQILGAWMDFAWPSPAPSFVNTRDKSAPIPKDTD